MAVKYKEKKLKLNYCWSVMSEGGALFNGTVRLGLPWGNFGFSSSTQVT